MDKILTIVVPVYKVEPYISKCLDSLIIAPHLMGKLDVLIVNDGTPDRSAEISREYVKRFPGIFRQIDKENGGHGSAWNLGTKLAIGKYLFYLDSDDWVDTGEFSKLVEYLLHCNVDMILLDKKHHYAGRDKYEDVVLTNIEPERVYDANTFDWLGCGNGANITYAHNTVYLTSMMKQYLPLYCERVAYDDVSLQVIPIALAESFVYTKLNVYRYFVGRIGQTYDPAVRNERIGDVTTVLIFVLTWMRTHSDIVPTGTTRRAWFDNLWWSFGAYHYETLSRLPYGRAKRMLRDWDAYYMREFPGIRVSSLVKEYRHLPFFAYFALFRIGYQIRRGIRFVKRVYSR